MTNKKDDMPDNAFLGKYSNKILYVCSYEKFCTEYTKTSTVKKQIAGALDKVEEAIDILYSAGHLNKFTVENILNEIKKQYEAEAYQ